MRLNEKLIAEIIQISIEKKHRKNDFLLKEGNTCNFIGLVKDGVIRSFIAGNEVEHNNDFFFANTFVCAYTSFITRAKQT